MAESQKTTKERISKRTLKKKLNAKRSEPKNRSQRFLNLEDKLIQENKVTLPLPEAVKTIRETATTKFDSSVEIHVHLRSKKGKKGAEDELARGILHLPHGLGKERNVAILTEEMIEDIAKTQTIPFDIALATPALMPKMGKIAKLLGTKGKMPNPKAGTVTDKPEEVKKEIESGRVEFRQDASRNVHQMIGKASWDEQKLVENAQVVMQAFPRNRVMSITLTSTMGPAVKINLDA